ncbi:MAG: hemerythrin domain-containing protein [Acidobacteriota bacterium]|nr:hemerythrin domain-containing protein [Acidobacteriota bacterium]
MFDWLLPEDHAIAILKKDHERVKQLFKAFEKAKGSAKKKIVRQAVTELKIHALLEEEIFYPAVRSHVGNQLMNEADEEHHIAKVLIAELDRGVPADHQDAKFTVLSESVRHHIGEEESEMLPKAAELKIDFEALGRKMLARKAELIKKGIPADTEHAVVAMAAGRTDSPAQTAKATHRKTARRASVNVARRKVSPAKSRAAGK